MRLDAVTRLEIAAEMDRKAAPKPFTPSGKAPSELSRRHGITEAQALYWPQEPMPSPCGVKGMRSRADRGADVKKIVMRHDCLSWYLWSRPAYECGRIRRERWKLMILKALPKPMLPA
jgi:hypothetical protein